MLDVDDVLALPQHKFNNWQAFYILEPDGFAIQDSRHVQQCKAALGHGGVFGYQPPDFEAQRLAAGAAAKLVMWQKDEIGPEPELTPAERVALMKVNAKK